MDRNSEEKIQERLGWVRKWERTDMDFRINCVFLDEPAFHINMKRSMAWSKKGSPGVVIVPKTRAQTTTISVAISASYLVKCSLRMPQPPAKKSKRGAYEQGTVTGHYLNFLMLQEKARVLSAPPVDRLTSFPMSPCCWHRFAAHPLVSGALWSDHSTWPGCSTPC